MTSHRRSLLSILLPALVALLAAATPAAAAPAVTQELDVPGKPGYITTGPDGNVWVVLDGSGPGNEDVARITPAGDVQGYDVPNLLGAVGISAGPGNTLWVTRSAKAVSFPADNPAAAQEFDVAGLGTPRDITLGPDGNLWAASGDTLMRIPPANPEGYTPFTILGMDARGIASDGERLWVASFGDGRVYSATTAGVATPHDVGGGPQEVVAGLAGQVAYSNQGIVPNEVGRLTNGGAALKTTVPGADPFGVAFGADQAYWFANFATNDLGRLTADGQYSVLGGLSAGSGPRHIAAGPNNTLWVSLELAGKVALVSGLEPPAPPTGPGTPIAPGDTPPIVSALAVTPKRFRVAKAPTAVTAGTRGKRRRTSAPAGTTIAFTLNMAATVKLTIERKLAGRKRGGKCVRPTRALRSAKRCVRYVKRGTLTRRISAGGAQRVKFSGRIGRRALGAGAYRLTAVATDAGGRSSVARRTTFTVVAPAR